MKQIFKVQGMSCGHCEIAITQALQQSDPLAKVQIDRTASLVEVESLKDRQELADAIVQEGYTVTIEGR
jgi:copper chaperone